VLLVDEGFGRETMVLLRETPPTLPVSAVRPPVTDRPCKLAVCPLAWVMAPWNEEAPLTVMFCTAKPVGVRVATALAQVGTVAVAPAVVDG
jgi:hypothetical protein